MFTLFLIIKSICDIIKKSNILAIYINIPLIYTIQFILIDSMIISTLVALLYYQFMKNIQNKYDYQNENFFHKNVTTIIKILFVIETLEYLPNHVLSDTQHHRVLMFLFRIIILDALNLILMGMFNKTITAKRLLYFMWSMAVTFVMYHKFDAVNLTSSEILAMCNCLFFWNIMIHANFIFRYFPHIEFIDSIHIGLQTPMLLSIYSFYFYMNWPNMFIPGASLQETICHIILQQMNLPLCMVIFSTIDLYDRLSR